MLVLINYSHVLPGREADFEAMYIAALCSSDETSVKVFSGFQGLYFLRPVQPSEPYVTLMYWESETALNAWRKSPTFRQSVASLDRSLLTGPPTMQLYHTLTLERPPQG